MASSGSSYNFFLVLLAVTAQGLPAQAATRLLTLEAQAVAGYSSRSDEAVFYSRDQREAMQKPGVGFDLLQRFSSQEGDIGSLALQGRLAWNEEGTPALEPQLYNAFVKARTRWAYFWVGHNRPALGLASYLDSHALLLQPLSMEGFGFDRDWGIGVSRDLPRGDWKASLTTGSGMPLALKGNWLASARTSWGILNSDNWNAGVSAAYGRPLDTMGVHLMDARPRELSLAGMDLSLFWDRWESRFEAMTGRRMDRDVEALMWRGTAKLDPEERLRLEIQPVLLRMDSKTDYHLEAGFSWLLTEVLSFRASYRYLHEANDRQIVTQLFYSIGI